MDSLFKKSLITFIILFLLPIKTIFSQEKEIIKKIIIDPSQKQRLLIPSIDNKNEKIKLIPPKSISESAKEKEIEAARKIQEEKRKALEEKRKKEIENARKIQEEKKKDYRRKEKKKK